MGELLNKIKENKYLNYKLNDIINMYNTYKQEEALEELENLIYEINLATIRQKLKIDVQEGNYNNIRKIYKEKDEELYQYYINIYAQYDEIYEKETENDSDDFLYLLQLVVSMLDIIFQKYGNIEIQN